MAARKKLSAKKRRKVKVIVFIVEIVLLLIVLAALYVSLKLAKLDSGQKIKDSDRKVNEDINDQTSETMETYRNIALFGLDNRSNGNYEEGNSDVIIICSINEKTKEVRLVSVYRDTYLYMTEDKHGYRKANAAYAYGGYTQAVNMLNVNLDLDIEDYVSFDFNAVANAIDILGGVEVEITDAEAKYMTGYIEEVARLSGKEAHYLSGGGTYVLDGVQATAYGRVRQTAGSDYKRTERQRLIISKLVEKAQKSDIATINNLIDEIFPDIKTSFTVTELLNLAKDAFDYKLGETTGFPFEKQGVNLGYALDCVAPVDLAYNVEELHKFLFENEEYEVSYTVQQISDQIVENTGLKRKETTEETTEGTSE